ncbi:septal ring lytic transglycosylase RlpA family protein [Hymenobacter polaris]|nr:septal ring lytic transglycosylase RlpA family protein [Hymenobacter polaris]
MLPTILPTAREGYQTVLRGRASWYGKFFQGMETASGERYNRFKYTCAHKKLPFGTRLRVTNVDNGVTVVVRVTDRGPFRHERILDLSEQAAKPLGLVQAGAATVIAVVVPDTTPLGLADTPADLALLRASDPRPRAPFTAYLLPLLRQSQELVAAVATAPAGPLASLPSAATATAPAVPGSRFEVPTGLFADAQRAEAALTRHSIDPSLLGPPEAASMGEQPANPVVTSQLDSWLAAETVRRNLQLWSMVGLGRHQLPDVAPQPVASAPATVAAMD